MTATPLTYSASVITKGVTERVLAANPGLSNTVFLTAGQEVELPEITQEKQRETVQLWD